VTAVEAGRASTKSRLALPTCHLKDVAPEI